MGLCFMNGRCFRFFHWRRVVSLLFSHLVPDEKWLLPWFESAVSKLNKLVPFVPFGNNTGNAVSRELIFVKLLYIPTLTLSLPYRSRPSIHPNADFSPTTAAANHVHHLHPSMNDNAILNSPSLNHLPEDTKQ